MCDPDCKVRGLYADGWDITGVITCSFEGSWVMLLSGYGSVGHVTQVIQVTGLKSQIIVSYTGDWLNVADHRKLYR